MPDWSELCFWLKKVVSSLVLLPAGPMFGIVVGLAFRRRRPALGAFLAAVSIATLFVFALPVVADALAAHDERQYPPLDAALPLPPRTAIVVLSGGSQQGATDYGGETVNPTTLARLRSAAHLALRTRLPVLVTGGRAPTALRAEAEEMADVLEHDFRVPVRWIEAASFDTADNARLSSAMLKDAGIDTAILVTDVSHMRRAREAFELTGLAVISAPTDYYAASPLTVLSFVPQANALRRSSWTIHEWLGIWWMRLRA